MSNPLNSLIPLAEQRASAAAEAKRILDATNIVEPILCYAVESVRSVPPKKGMGADRKAVAAPRTFAPRTAVFEVVGWSSYGTAGETVEAYPWVASDNGKLFRCDEHRCYVKVSALRDLTSAHLSKARELMATPAQPEGLSFLG